MGEAWDKARHIAKNVAPRSVLSSHLQTCVNFFIRFEQYVEDAYVEYLREKNNTEEVWLFV